MGILYRHTYTYRHGKGEALEVRYDTDRVFLKRVGCLVRKERKD